METQNLTHLYISVWAWHILGIIFLTSSLNIFASSSGIIGNAFFMVFLMGFTLCELMSYERRKQLKEDGEKEQ